MAPWRSSRQAIDLDNPRKARKVAAGLCKVEVFQSACGVWGESTLPSCGGVCVGWSCRRCYVF